MTHSALSTAIRYFAADAVVDHVDVPVATLLEWADSIDGLGKEVAADVEAFHSLQQAVRQSRSLADFLAVQKTVAMIEDELRPNYAACCASTDLRVCDCVNKLHIRVLFGHSR